MHINLIKLKIKIKHLALEPALIRIEERKLLKQAAWRREHQTEENQYTHEKYWDYETLRNHRIYDVRREARATQLAYAFLRGKKYEDIEQKRESNYWTVYFNNKMRKRIIDIVYKYQVTTWVDKEVIEEQINSWLEYK